MKICCMNICFTTDIYKFSPILRNIYKVFFELYIYVSLISVISIEASAKSFKKISSNNIDSGCSPTSDPKCLKCNEGSCVKCAVLLVIDTRLCSDICPFSYNKLWSTHPEVMGKICLPQNNFGSSTYAALIGSLVGFLLSLAFLTIFIISIRRQKQCKGIKQMLLSSDLYTDQAQFLNQLNELRPHAEHILSMLNDTRQQIRKFHLSGETHATDQYRLMLKDLAILLILLNRPVESLPAQPHDWLRIYVWIKKTLEQNIAEVVQLIDFCQNDSQTNQNVPRFDLLRHKHYSPSHRSSGQSNRTTFFDENSKVLAHQTVKNIDNSYQMQVFGSLISLHEFDEPTLMKPNSSNLIENSLNVLRNRISSHSSTNLFLKDVELQRNSFRLEDEFFRLGFRPQDEITTEL